MVQTNPDRGKYLILALGQLYQSWFDKCFG